MDALDVDCIVIGGVADGVLMTVKQGARIIELSAPDFVKPLTSPNQREPEIARTRTRYNIFYMGLPTINGVMKPFAWAIEEGKSPAWAAKQLAIAYVKYSTEKMKAEANEQDTLQ